MFGFGRSLAINSETREWVDQNFRRLAGLLGDERMLQAPMVLPNDEFFPDKYDRSKESACNMFCRVCQHMSVDAGTVELHIFGDETENLREIMPYWSGQGGDCAGVYFHEEDASRYTVGLNRSKLDDPIALVGTLAHELCHVILLGQKLVKRDEPDMELLTDLLTVFLGFGIFTGNSAERFSQWQDDRKIGWSMERIGYLPQPVFGYALAKFAIARGDTRPTWKGYLSTNLKADFSRSVDFLLRESKT